MSESPPSPPAISGSRKRTLKSVCYAVLVLLSGIIIGMAFMFHFHPMPMMMPPIPERAPEEITRMLRHELGLDDDQATAMLEIMKKDREALESIRKKTDADVLQQLETSQERIHEILRPEQIEIFDKRFNHLKSRFQPDIPPGSDAPFP
jgi:hypothetical protein